MYYFYKLKINYLLIGALVGFGLTGLALIFTSEPYTAEENFQLIFLGSVITAVIFWVIGLMPSNDIAASSHYDRDSSADFYHYSSHDNDSGGGDGGCGGD